MASPIGRIRLVAIDMDYTLLGDDFQIDDRDVATIRRVVEAGCVVTLATGRMYSSVLPYARRLGLDVPLITYNGAYVRSVSSDQVYSHIPLEADRALQFVQYASSHDLYCSVYVDDHLYASRAGWELERYTSSAGVSATVLDDIVSFVASGSKRPTKALIVANEGVLDQIEPEIRQSLGRECYLTRSISIYLELMNRQVSKARALMDLAASLGILMDSVMAIGDSYNDIDMLQVAGIGVAMGNAPDLVKQAADFVTLSNREQGVSHALERFVLGGAWA